MDSRVACQNHSTAAVWAASSCPPFAFPLFLLPFVFFLLFMIRAQRADSLLRKGGFSRDYS